MDWVDNSNIERGCGGIFQDNTPTVVAISVRLWWSSSLTDWRVFCSQDDILTAAYCHPNYLATASFDGDIILWGLDREKMIRRIKKGSGSLL